LLAAVSGAIGTAILFFNSYAFEPMQGGIFGSPELTEADNHILAKNRSRAKWQEVGLAFLTALLQRVSRPRPGYKGVALTNSIEFVSTSPFLCELMELPQPS
jgi:hypothetical protein